MKILKKVVLIPLFAIFTVTTQAQNSKDLNGKWEAYYEQDNEKGYVTYEFKTEDKKLKAYSTLLKDVNGYKVKDNTLTLNEIKFSKGKGKCKYLIKYKEKVYNVPAKLILIDENTLEVSYSYYGYSDTETWKREY
ncbi:hypothetical protein [Maribacter ulvicola]|uniref:DUF4488 domain-containing protein n=1 Tax=Maribacter ulvicola TaxID=228959 RepID=A0A1N6QWI9_9FLAO|nr:hypothetical protein [Maribacter ulvicola]SIQ20994.1 hypothetical protein SAMN05421797_1011051 [Maribacter ulvicola]